MSSLSVLKVLILSAFVASALGYIYIIPPQIAKSKDYDNSCYYEQEKALLKVQETRSLPNCEEITCNDDYSMTLFGCGSYSVHDPNCIKFTRDFTKPYPQCCNSVICVEYSTDKQPSYPDQLQVESNVID